MWNNKGILEQTTPALTPDSLRCVQTSFCQPRLFIILNITRSHANRSRFTKERRFKRRCMQCCWKSKVEYDERQEGEGVESGREKSRSVELETNFLGTRSNEREFFQPRSISILSFLPLLFFPSDIVDIGGRKVFPYPRGQIES